MIAPKQTKPRTPIAVVAVKVHWRVLPAIE